MIPGTLRSALIKPNYFKRQHSLSSYLFKAIIQVQNGNGVLKRQVPCPKRMELAC